MRKRLFRPKWIVPIAVAVVALFAPTAALAGTLTLHPAGFGPQSYASWKANQGLPDSNPLTNQALYFQKDTPTSTNAAGVVLIHGLAGTKVSDLTGLSWDRRTDGHCGGGAPRWDIFVTGSSGTRYTLFLGCDAAAHTPVTATDPGNHTWCMDSFAGNNNILDVGTVSAGLTGSFSDIQAGTIRDLAIVFDVGNDSPPTPTQPPCAGEGLPGFVYLDNVTVAANGVTQTWTSAADNGTTAARSFGTTAAYADDLLLSPDQILAELTDLFPGVALTDWILYPNVMP